MIPRSTIALRFKRATSLRGGFLIDAGQIGIVDAEDGGRFVAVGDAEVAPAGARPDVTAQLLPEQSAPPAPVTLRWIRGGSSRQFGGVSVGLGDIFTVDATTAAGLLHDQVAEVVDA